MLNFTRQIANLCTGYYGHIHEECVLQQITNLVYGYKYTRYFSLKNNV